MTEQVRPPTTRAANGAPGGARLLARASRPGTPTALKRTWVPEAWREGRPIARLAYGSRSQGSQRLPALHSPFGEEGKQGPRARPGARNQTHGTAERWLFEHASHPTGVIPGHERKRASPESRAYQEDLPCGPGFRTRRCAPPRNDSGVTTASSSPRRCCRHTIARSPSAGLQSVAPSSRPPASADAARD